MENVFFMFYDHLEYFMAIWYNLWQFGTVCGDLVYFSPIWYAQTKKNLATLMPSGNVWASGSCDRIPPGMYV
jgi:hypothetical protein